MNDTIKFLRKYRDVLTKQEIASIRGQILAGQYSSAFKGLNKCLTRHGLGGVDHATIAKTLLPVTRLREPFR